MREWYIDTWTWWTNWWFDHPIIFVVAGIAIAIAYYLKWKYRET